jgi:hypothetical protein
MLLPERASLMKRSYLFLSTLLLISSMAFASSRPGRGHDKPRYSTPEPGIVSMLGLSVGTIAGGLVLRYRRDK